MKCESCGNELTGGAIICRVCNHNNALRGGWRSQRSNQQPGQTTPPRHFRETQANQSRATSSMTELPRIVPRKDADANLIHFPPASNRPALNRYDARRAEARQPAPTPQTLTASESGTATEPSWRAELKERVRQIRERRNTGELAPPSPPDQLNEVNLDRNPIVESALNRIRWSSHTPAITSTASSARAAARLPQCEIESAPAPQPETRTQPRPEPRLEPRIESRVVAPRPATNRPGDQSKSQATNRVETKTLTPKTHRETGALPEPKPAFAPASKILTPRAKPQTATEAKAERREPSTAPQPQTGKPLRAASNKQVATQVIEIAQAPELPPLPEAQPASLWVRTLAGACDFEIIATTYLPLFGAYAVLNTSLGPESFLIMLLLLAAITFVYQVVMLNIAGRTFGMAMLNLNLVNTDDESMPLTRRQLMLRAVTATFAFLLPPLNYLVTRLNVSQRSLPDLISGATVSEQ